MVWRFARESAERNFCRVSTGTELDPVSGHQMSFVVGRTAVRRAACVPFMSCLVAAEIEIKVNARKWGA